MSRLAAACAALALLATACAGASLQQRQPETGNDGVHATGRLDGRRVAISDSDPEVNTTDCDPGLETDTDVCWIARTIDGLTVAFVIENPAALVPGERLAVGEDACSTCDEVTGHAVVDLRVDGQQRRAHAGHLAVQQVDERWTAEFRLRFDDGDELTGSFDIRQLAPGER